MPLSQPRFEGRQMLVDASDHVDRQDVEIMFLLARQHAERSGSPVNLIIDTEHVEFVTIGARMAFSEGVSMSAIHALVFFASDPLMLQTLRTVQLLAEQSKIHIFTTWRDVRLWLSDQAALA